MYDGVAGTLSFYRCGVNLGVVFLDLNKVEGDLYPAIACTVYRTEFLLTEHSSLQERCIDVIAEQLSCASQAKLLPLPRMMREAIAKDVQERAGSRTDRMFLLHR